MSGHGTFERYLALDIECRVERNRQRTSSEANDSSPCIFRFPRPLTGLIDNADIPEMVSIGPYHHGLDKLKAYEEHKWSALDKFLRRRSTSRNLMFCLQKLGEMENRAKACYSEIITMPSSDFVLMMLLDGCFVIEVLYNIFPGDNTFSIDLWQIPTLIGDLIKMENQIPFFILQTLFEEWDPGTAQSEGLANTALKVLHIVNPSILDRSTIDQVAQRLQSAGPKHLLDLYRLSLIPSDQVIINTTPVNYFPSDQSIQSVTQLRLSGIKFKPNEAANFFLIDFQNGVLKIPPIAINDFLSILLINCVAYEQCQKFVFNYFTDYVAFMSSLIVERKDVAFLCGDGILKQWSNNDDLFVTLRETRALNNRGSYLLKQISEVEDYYSSNRAYMMRTYFRNPWAFFSLVYAVIIGVLTTVQTAMNIYQKYR